MTYQIGDLVYRPYTPTRVGVVVSVLCHRLPRMPDYTVRFMDGTSVSGPVWNDYRALIEDHRRKLAHHEERLQALDAFRSGVLAALAAEHDTQREAEQKRGTDGQ